MLKSKKIMAKKKKIFINRLMDGIEISNPISSTEQRKKSQCLRKRGIRIATEKRGEIIFKDGNEAKKAEKILREGKC